MHQHRRSFLLALVALAVFLGSALTGGKVQAAGGSDPRLEGVLVSMAAPAVGIRTQAGVVRVIVIPTTAKIERNGVRTNLSAFKLGDRVQARFTSNGAVVTKFEGVGP
ncbi:MAG: hypothetical protein U0905_11310 [Pirellulales bacterium]